MSDNELSDVGGDEDIVRAHDFSDDDAPADRQAPNDDANVSGEEVKDGDGDGNDKDKKDDSSKPKTTRKMVILNTERLKGSKGVHTIEKLFEGFKFRGKGYEKNDLDQVMKHLEHWAFRMFPKMDFDDILAKCEHLGTKKDMQVHLKKYRLDMITANYPTDEQNEIIEEDDQEDDSADVNVASQPMRNANDEEFDRLMAENNETNTTVVNIDNQPTEDIDDDEFERLMALNAEAVEQDAIQSQMEVV